VDLTAILALHHAVAGFDVAAVFAFPVFCHGGPHQCGSVQIVQQRLFAVNPAMHRIARPWFCPALTLPVIGIARLGAGDRRSMAIHRRRPRVAAHDWRVRLTLFLVLIGCASATATFARPVVHRVSAIPKPFWGQWRERTDECSKTGTSELIIFGPHRFRFDGDELRITRIILRGRNVMTVFGVVTTMPGTRVQASFTKPPGKNFVVRDSEIILNRCPALAAPLPR
jgi:hypothetical protein